MSSKDERGGIHPIPWLKYSQNAIKSEAIHSFVACNAFCYLVIPYAILQYFVWLLTKSVQIVLTTLMRLAYGRSRHLYQQRSLHMRE